MKILIAGTNGITDYYKLIDKAIDFAKIDRKKIKTVACIDNLVKKWAENNFHKTKKFDANWLDLTAEDAIIKTGKDGIKYNAAAAFQRNEKVVKYVNCAVLIYKAGDKNIESLIEKLKENNKKVYIYEI